MRHIDYIHELEYKQNKVEECVKRIGGIDICTEEILPSEKRERYRNKAVFPIAEDYSFGFYAAGSHRVIGNDDCLLQPEIFSVVCSCFTKWAKKSRVPIYNENTGSGVIRKLFIRIAEATDELMIVPVISGKLSADINEFINLLKENISNKFTVILNYNSSQGNSVFGERYETVYGDGYIVDILCGKKFKLSPQSFYQVNRKQAERLYSEVAEYAESQDKTVLDLYCGTGTIGLSMAHKAKKIIGAEIVPMAIEDAKVNAELNGIKNAEFICGDAARVAEMLSQNGVEPNIVILDPPRKGCDKTLIETVALKFAPERVVYVSCDPATLSRDLAEFKKFGYLPKKVRPVDMFPNTAHVETVCLLSRV